MWQGSASVVYQIRLIEAITMKKKKVRISGSTGFSSHQAIIPSFLLPSFERLSKMVYLMMFALYFRYWSKGRQRGRGRETDREKERQSSSHTIVFSGIRSADKSPQPRRRRGRGGGESQNSTKIISGLFSQVSGSLSFLQHGVTLLTRRDTTTTRPSSLSIKKARRLIGNTHARKSVLLGRVIDCNTMQRTVPSKITTITSLTTLFSHDPFYSEISPSRSAQGGCCYLFLVHQSGK